MKIFMTNDMENSITFLAENWDDAQSKHPDDVLTELHFPPGYSLVRWIPISESMPPPDHTVLVRGMGEATYNPKLECWDTYEGGYTPEHYPVEKADEWMEYPE